MQFQTKFEILDGHKIEKKENFKNSHITFLYHFDIYLYEQSWLNLPGSFLEFGQFMLTMAIFSAKGDFPYILKFRPRVIACKMKSFDNWETYDPILERRKIGLQHMSKWTKSIFWLDVFLWPSYEQLRVLGGVQPKKIDFVHFDICWSLIFPLSKMGSYVSQLSKLFLLQALSWGRYFKI